MPERGNAAETVLVNARPLAAYAAANIIGFQYYQRATVASI